GDVSKGSQWTVSQVQAVVSSGLWPRVAIFITWDDWGGWWDHVTPPEVEKWKDGTQFHYGGRVGCLVLSPFARKSYVSKALHPHDHVFELQLTEPRRDGLHQAAAMATALSLAQDVNRIELAAVMVFTRAFASA